MRRRMPNISFQRVRAEVTELWSREPVSDPRLVQRMVEYHSSLGLLYPDVKAVDRAQGLWDSYLPEDVVHEFDKRGDTEFQIEAVDRNFRVRFLDEG
jgi:hypothetical protein